MTAPLELRDALSTADGPSLTLRCAIARILRLWPDYDHDAALLPAWDDSIDAALALARQLLPGWHLYALSEELDEANGKTLFWAAVFEPREWFYVKPRGMAEAATAPLAILQALAQALIHHAAA